MSEFRSEEFGMLTTWKPSSRGCIVICSKLRSAKVRKSGLSQPKRSHSRMPSSSRPNNSLDPATFQPAVHVRWQISDPTRPPTESWPFSTCGTRLCCSGDLSFDKVQCGCFLKWWYQTTIGFPTKNDHFGVLPPFKETPMWKKSIFIFPVGALFKPTNNHVFPLEGTNLRKGCAACNLYTGPSLPRWIRTHLHPSVGSNSHGR